VLAFAAIFVMVTTDKAWGVSTPLVTLDVAILQKLGIHFSPEHFSHHIEKVDAGLLKDGGTIRNIGLFFGCMVSFLMAHRFKIDMDFSFKD
ncbi:YeeE/YedE family protein, partial [Streptococcus pyogenes]